MSSTYGVMPSQPPTVEFFAPAPQPQDRLSAVIRLIMAIPQFFVLYFVDIALSIVALIGWFAALFTGRLPDFAQDFITGVIRWWARVYGYFFFLTDRYPPFSLQDEDYPIRISLPPPTELNRLAVLFRIIIAIPAYVVAGIAMIVLEVCSIASWAIVSFSGSGTLPESLYRLTRSVLRYQTRFAAWLYMLTSEYPWGLLDDLPQPTAPGPAAA
jgi:hypothetical protein